MKTNNYRSEKILIKYVNMILICGAYLNYIKNLYLTWNKEDNQKKSSKVKKGPRKKILTKKELWAKIHSWKLRKKIKKIHTKMNLRKNSYWR